MYRIILTTAALFVLSLLAVPAHGADWFVSPDGADQTGAGTLQRPWKSIQKALAAASPGDRVVLRGGEYRLAGGEGTVRFPRSGEPDKPITVTAYNSEYPALLGSVRLTDWRPHEGRIFKCPAPSKPVYGLYEDAVRLNHPRATGKRENPPVSSLQGPGQWTAAQGWIYLWCREGDSPANHRIEASQIVVLSADRPWVRIEKLHIFFGQPIGLNIHADHVVVDGVEVAHVSNSVDNAYAAYFSSCSNSVLRNSTVHDSYYWGDHGSNSHLVSCIDCGDRGPNFVENCDLFDGGLGVGTKEAAREMVIFHNRIRDVCRGAVISGERQSGPGTGKTDRGHYLVYGNTFRDCTTGVYFASGETRENRIYNNLFQRCGSAVYMFDYRGLPQQTELANNIFLNNESAIFCVAGRKGQETLPAFLEASLRSHHNWFFGNRADWCNPLDWSRSLEQTFRQVQSYRGYGWEAGSIGRDPAADPAPAAGAALELPAYVPKPGAWTMGPTAIHPSTRGLTLSIAGCPTTIAAGETIALRAALRNEAQESTSLDGDALVTFHFRNASVWHRDKQEIHRVRVKLAGQILAPGQSLELAALPGWANPTNGRPGDPFHLRADQEWRSGWRLSASVRIIGREDATGLALQRLERLTRSNEVLHVKCK